MTPATIRTAAAYVVGAILAFLAQQFGFVLDENSSTELVSAMAVLFGTAYYVVVRLVAQWLPWVEWFLVVPKAPVYVKPENRAKVQRDADQFGM